MMGKMMGGGGMPPGMGGMGGMPGGVPGGMPGAPAAASKRLPLGWLGGRCVPCPLLVAVGKPCMQWFAPCAPHEWKQPVALRREVAWAAT